MKITKLPGQCISLLGEMPPDSSPSNQASRSGALLVELAEQSTAHMSRILRLTLLAPDIIAAILDGRQPESLTLADLMEPYDCFNRYFFASRKILRPKQPR